MDLTWNEGNLDTVDGVFDRALEEHADALFLDFSGELFTYGDVAGRVARAAHALRAAGVKRGDTVGMVLDNNVDAVVVRFAANRIGAISVAVSPAYRGEFLRHQLADSGVRVLIAEHHYLDRVVAVEHGLPGLEQIWVRTPVGSPTAEPSTAGSTKARQIDYLELLSAHSEELPSSESGPADLSTLIYTAGTTGLSKGCMVSHNYTMHLARQYGDLTCRLPGEHAWSALPLFHFNAWSCTVLTSAVYGASASISPRFSVSGFWEDIERTGARVATLLGPMAALLAQAPDSEASRRCHGQLRVVQSAPFTPESIAGWKERFGVQLAGANAFGLTECAMTTHLPLDQPAPPGSSGRRNEFFDVRIFDDKDVEVPPGESGEIVVRPKMPNVMFDGYWGRPDATIGMMGNLWFHTGDIGKFDDEGYFYFVDRKKDYLRRRGENISSFEMERSILEHDGIQEVAVHAVPSELSEDEIKVTAVLVPGSKLIEHDLCAWLTERVPYFAVPRFIEFRPELPKNGVGRVTKYVLRDQGVTVGTWDRETSDLTVERR